MSGDHLERVTAFLDLRSETGQFGTIAMTAALGMRREKLTDDDLRALVAEVEQLREVIAAADDPTDYRRWLIRNLGSAYAAGWEAHADLVSGTLATLGSDKREQCGRAWVADRLADLNDDDEADAAPQQPEHDGEAWVEALTAGRREDGSLPWPTTPEQQPERGTDADGAQ